MRKEQKTPFMRWIDGQFEADPQFAQKVEELVTEMKIEQELVALRHRRGLSQQGLAKLLGTSQPYVAKLEAGRVKNLGLKTLIRCATALGGTVTVKIGPTRRSLKTPRRRPSLRRRTRKAPLKAAAKR